MRSWVIVASAARARVFASAGRHEPWTELWDMVNSEGRMAAQDFVSDKPGRTVDGARGQHHTLDPSADPKERAAQQFAREVAARLDKDHQEKKIDRLTVVAPPHFLGLLREYMSEAVARAVVDEVAKDLTREDAAELQEHVASLV